MGNAIQTADDRLLISREWARVGGSFNVAPANHAVVIENLLVRSAKQAPVDYRLFFLAATWLGVHYHLVDMRRLGRELDALRGLESAVAGAMISVAHGVDASPRLEAAGARCRPLRKARPLFDRVAENRVLRELARRDALPVFSRWGLWHDEISLKLDAVKPIRWILERCPELRIRALVGASLEGEIIQALFEEPQTIANLARTTGATYASAHEATTRLAARGLVEPFRRNGQRGLALPASVERWIRTFPAADRGRSGEGTKSPAKTRRPHHGGNVG